MKKWLFNPFIYIAGAKALIIGWAFMLVAAVIGYFSMTHFDGVFDVHIGHISPMWTYITETAIDWALPAIIFYIAGLIFSNSSIRAVDVAGTLALARWVMVFPALIGFGVHMPPAAPATIDEVMKILTPSVIVFGLLTMLFSIWMIALMYNAYTTSCNLKGSKAILSFIGGLLVAEVLSKLIIGLIF